MFNRLLAAKYCSRIQGFGDDAFILTGKGAARIRAISPEEYPSVRSGVRLRSVKGASWQHRRAADTYLADRYAQGFDIATEYETLTNSVYWRFIAQYLPHDIKRGDGVYYRIFCPDQDSYEVTEIRWVEMIRTAPRQSESKDKPHSDMFALLDAIRRLTKAGIGIDLVFWDDVQGHAAADEIARAALTRDIEFDSRLVDRVWITPTSDNKGPINYYSERWPATTPAKTRPAQRVSPCVPANLARHPFRIISDERTPDGRREVKIRHLPKDLMLCGKTGIFGNEGYLEFDEYDDQGVPKRWTPVVVLNSIDLNDPAQREDLFAQLFTMLKRNGRI